MKYFEWIIKQLLNFSQDMKSSADLGGSYPPRPSASVCTSLEKSSTDFKSTKKHRIFSLVLKEAFCQNSINISNCRYKQIPYQYAQTRIFGHLVKEHNFWKRSTLLKKTSNTIRKFDCPEFSQFKTLSGCRAYNSHKIWLQVHVESARQATLCS